MMTTSSTPKRIWDIRDLRKAFSGHRHPLPASRVPPPIESRRTPACSGQKSPGMSSTLGLIEKKEPELPGGAPVRSAMSSSISPMGVIPSGSGKPSVAARLLSGSPSTAITWAPSLANEAASPALSVVLPTPPFPLTAIFKSDLLRRFTRARVDSAGSVPSCSGRIQR